MSEHAKLSPSGSARWLSCPGSYWLSEQAPQQPSSAAADEGTDAHEWAAKMVDKMDIAMAVLMELN